MLKVKLGVLSRVELKSTVIQERRRLAQIERSSKAEVNDHHSSLRSSHLFIFDEYFGRILPTLFTKQEMLYETP